MPVDEGARHKLYIAAEQTLGLENAETLMSLLPPVGWADVATKQDIALVRHDIAALEERVNRRFEAVDNRFEAVDNRFAALEERMNLRFEAVDNRFTGLEERMNLRFESLEHKFDARLESSLRGQTRTFVTWLLASQASTVTVVIAALALFR